jgi:hypothetical protein
LLHPPDHVLDLDEWMGALAPVFATGIETDDFRMRTNVPDTGIRKLVESPVVRATILQYDKIRIGRNLSQRFGDSVQHEFVVDESANHEFAVFSLAGLPAGGDQFLRPY